MHLLNPRVRTQETIHSRRFPNMVWNATKLNVDQERQDTTLGTSQTAPTLTQEAEVESRRTDWLPQLNQTINQGQFGEDQQVT